MRVTCDSLEDFLDNLKCETGGCVFRNVVYWNELRSPLDQDKRNAIRYLVSYRVSAIVDIEDGQYLIIAEDECGIDYCDVTQEKLGTEECKKMHKRLLEFCQENGLEIRLGVVDF